jgi:hypothetical protein
MQFNAPGPVTRARLDMVLECRAPQGARHQRRGPHNLRLAAGRIAGPGQGRTDDLAVPPWCHPWRFLFFPFRGKNSFKLRPIRFKLRDFTFNPNQIGFVCLKRFHEVEGTTKGLS